MQPAAGALNPQQGGEVDLSAMQSMDWLFKKERIYLLAQFWQQRATLAEKEVTTLKEQISNNSTSNSDSDGNMDRHTYENELIAKEKEINHLLDEVQKQQITINKLQESSITQITRLEDQLEQKRQIISRLEAKIDAQKDYDELKRELSILKPELVNTIVPKIEENEEKQEEMRSSTPITDSEENMMCDEKTPSENAEKMSETSATTPQPSETPSSNENNQNLESMVNGERERDRERDRDRDRKSPEDNNNHHLSNNNIPLSASMCNFLRSDLKQFNYDDHRPPFRFAEDLGMAPGSMVGRLGESLIPKGDPMEAKLQEMLRYNMDKYASHNLDTLHISKRVRELLSIHNIGQRLFAKYILGLSQGTVSELLSKPKPWDKLTEKGRDSYRKMHAWACDENAVMLLKSLIPKKDHFSPGKDSGIPPFGLKPEGDLTDERIAHILSEASFQSQSMKMEDSRSNDDSKSPHGQCLSPFSRSGDLSQSKRLKKYENDDIPQEKVVRIYQEELVKLMGRRMEDFRSPREPFSGMFFPQMFSGNPMDRTQEEIRLALDAYHRELSKLNQGGQVNPSQLPLGLLALQQQALAQAAQQNGGVQDLSVPKDSAKMQFLNGLGEKESLKEDDRHSGSAFSLVRPKIEPGTQPNSNSSTSSPLGNTILPPINSSDEFSTSSPLQRMASITNSLISQPTNSSHHSTPNRPLKAVLPPITQQQFDLYNNLNTEDIVKKVKEQLSQYSISQRLFGESVLGLSQGSVSDLLARPKPWHMLTQKGREPFIRMKMFLEDDNAVHKLVASQYKIAPEKLMRTGGYGGASCTSLPKPMPPTPKMLQEAAGLLNKMQENAQSLLPPSLQLAPPQVQTSQPSAMLLTPPGLPPHHPMNMTSPSEHLKKSAAPSPLAIPHSPLSHQGGPAAIALRNMHQHMSPSVYEMAALTQDLDTQVITTKIKEALLANNIGQKIFGEAVLGLSQGSVSELLSKPKPWHMLSIKGREPFIRMQLWLNDAHNVDRLQALKNERREANKRRRSSGAGAHDNSSDTSSNDTSEFYHSNSPGPGPGGPPSSKKQRVLFSEEQKEALKIAFALDPYPNVQTIEFLASELGLSSRTITNWFHNHRMRLKQQVPHGVPMDLPPRDQSGSQPPFDPIQFRLLLNQRILQISKERMGLSGVPLPYPPYLAANTNLAALISRGLLPTSDLDLSALNHAVKEQMNGLDLTLKRDPNDFEDDDDAISNVGSEDSNMSGSIHGEIKTETKEPQITQQGGRSRRKPAAPQWVNPVWQDDTTKKSDSDTVNIINGVCVMQTEDYARRQDEENTVRIEPAPVHDRFEEEDEEEVSEKSSIASLHQNEDEEIIKNDEDKIQIDEEKGQATKENEEEEDQDRWNY